MPAPALFARVYDVAPSGELLPLFVSFSVHEVPLFCRYVRQSCDQGVPIEAIVYASGLLPSGFVESLDPVHCSFFFPSLPS